MGWPLGVGQEVWSFCHEIDKRGIVRVPDFLDVGSIEIGDCFEDSKRRKRGSAVSPVKL